MDLKRHVESATKAFVNAVVAGAKAHYRNDRKRKTKRVKVSVKSASKKSAKKK